MTFKPSKAGKGDDPRPVDKNKYDKNFDSIFRKKKTKKIKLTEKIEVFAPTDLAECLDIILKNMPEMEIITLAESERKDLISYHHTLGQLIRNKFGLWFENCKFFDYMIETYKIHEKHPNAVSMFIIEALWELLQLSIKELEKEKL